MKKLILSVFVAGTLVATGCKKAKEVGNDMKDATVEAADKTVDVTKEVTNTVVDGTKNAANTVSDAVKSAFDDVSIPSFEDPKIGEHLKAYSEYAKEYIAAGKDAYKNADLMERSKDLAAKGKAIVASLDEASAKKFKSVMSAIQSKMAPSH